MSYQPTEAELLSHGFVKTPGENSHTWVKLGVHAGKQAFLYLSISPEGWNEGSILVAGELDPVADVALDTPLQLKATVEAFAGKGARDCRFICTDEGGCVGPYEWVKVKSEGNREEWTEPVHYCQQAIASDRAMGYIVEPTNPF